MQFNDLKINMKVKDKWFFDWGTGKVTVIKKTITKIAFYDQIRTFDKQHVQFLEEA